MKVMTESDLPNIVNKVIIGQCDGYSYYNPNNEIIDWLYHTTLNIELRNIW